MGAKFNKLVSQLAAKGAHDPEALAAWIGRRKLGKTAFQKLAAAGHHGGHSGGHHETRGVSRHEIKSGRLDESRMGPAELAFRRAKQAKKTGRKK